MPDRSPVALESSLSFRAGEWLRLQACRLYGGATPPVSIWHQFFKPPYGGGNQFLLALRHAFHKMGLRTLANRSIDKRGAWLLNAINFDASPLDRLDRPQSVVHRINGPFQLYRGSDASFDERLFSINRRYATTTIVQSHYALERFRSIGLDPVNPLVIHNAPDPRWFFRPKNKSPASGRKIRLIAASWSGNPRKGGPDLKWLEENLDSDRFELTFVGNSSARLSRSRMLAPVPSRALGQLLRQQDIYLAFSQYDPCSNALLEALASGLPAVYLNSGGHPELVGSAGIAIDSIEEAPRALERLAADLPRFQDRIQITPLHEIALAYARQLYPEGGF